MKKIKRRDRAYLIRVEMELPPSFFYMMISSALFVVAAYAIMRSIGKEQPITVMSPIFSILVQVLFLVAYTMLAGLNLFAPLFIPSMLLGLAIGLIIGGTTEIYRKQDRILSKRRKGFLLFWIFSIILNQALISLGFGQGLALTIFSTGTLIGSEGNIMYKISRAKPHSEEVEVTTRLPPKPRGKPKKMLCPNCNAPIVPTYKYCTRCGEKIYDIEG